MSDWDLLHPNVSQIVVKKGWNPTPIQKNSIPAILEGNDVLLIAPTGSGKTLSFAIPMVHGILEDFEKESLVKTEDESCEETSEKTCLTDSMPESGEYFQFYEKIIQFSFSQIFFKVFTRATNNAT